MDQKLTKLLNKETTPQLNPTRRISNSIVPEIGNIVSVVPKKDVILSESNLNVDNSHSINSSLSQKSANNTYTNCALANLNKFHNEETHNLPYYKEQGTSNINESQTPIGRFIVNNIHNLVSTPDSKNKFKNASLTDKDLLSNNNNHINSALSIINESKEKNETNFSTFIQKNHNNTNNNSFSTHYNSMMHNKDIEENQTINQNQYTNINPIVHQNWNNKNDNDDDHNCMPILKTKSFNNPSIINMTNNSYNIHGTMQVMNNESMGYENMNSNHYKYEEEGINKPQRSISSQMIIQQSNDFGNNYFNQNNTKTNYNNITNKHNNNHRNSNQWNKQQHYNINNLTNDFEFMSIQQQQLQYQPQQYQYYSLQQQQPQYIQQEQYQNNFNYFPMNNESNFPMYTHQNINIQQQQPFQNAFNSSTNLKTNFQSPKKKNHGLSMNFNTMSTNEIIKKSNLISKDQAGCRLLQKIIDEQPEMASILIINSFENLIEIITDPFGNYLIQKLYDFMNEDQLLQLMALLKITISQVCTNSFGTRAIQNLIEFLKTEKLQMNFMMIIKPFIKDLIVEINGGHIILRLISDHPHKILPILEEICKNVVIITTHKHGCCVLQKCIEKLSNHFQKEMIINSIIDNCQELIIDQYGNYIIQYVIHFKNEKINEKIVSILSEDIVSYSRQKYSSNVVEKCFEICSDTVCNIMISQMITEEIVLNLLFDKFGNYVFQKALNRAKKQTQVFLLKCIAPHLHKLKNHSFGLRLYSKLILAYPFLSAMILGSRIEDNNNNGNINTNNCREDIQNGYNNDNANDNDNDQS